MAAARRGSLASGSVTGAGRLGWITTVIAGERSQPTGCGGCLLDEQVDHEAHRCQNQDEDDDGHASATPASASTSATSATNYDSASTSHGHPSSLKSMGVYIQPLCACIHHYPTHRA